MISINERFIIDTFVITDANKEAYKIVRDICDRKYLKNNIFYFNSEKRVGKSHLFQAITKEMNDSKLLYVETDDFQVDCTRYINNECPEFKSKYYTKDLIIFDGINLLYKKDKVSNELLNILRFMVENNKKVIVSNTTSLYEEVDFAWLLEEVDNINNLYMVNIKGTYSNNEKKEMFKKFSNYLYKFNLNDDIVELFCSKFGECEDIFFQVMATCMCYIRYCSTRALPFNIETVKEFIEHDKANFDMWL